MTTEEKKYRISKEHCKDMISGVCNGCGGELTPMETIDNAGNPTYWAGCENCQKFCNGVPVKVFKAARILVEKYYHTPYKHCTRPKEGTNEYQYWLESQTSGACHTITKVTSALNDAEQNV